MSKVNKIIAPFLILILLCSIIACCIVAIDNNQVIAEVKTEENEHKTIFDGVINLVSEKGADIVKNALPTVGDFLCAQLFNYLGIDYTDSFTKEIQQVNKKLDEIESQLKEILKKMDKIDSQNIMKEVLNVVDTFSLVIHPKYVAYNTLIRKEKDGSLTAEEAKEVEKNFYEDCKNNIFGTSSTTGTLYVQINDLMKKITNPSSDNKTIMEHYIITYEHLWAFDMQSFMPKKEFLGYLTTTTFEGLMLYMFQYNYELSLFENDEVKLAEIEEQWKKTQKNASNVFEYLQKEINVLQEQIDYSNNTNSTLHYATKERVSKKLFTGKVIEKNNKNSSNSWSAKSNYFTYRSITSDRQGRKTFYAHTLDNRKFVKSVFLDYEKYLENYKKIYESDKTFTFVNFLQNVGFICDDWSILTGVYMGQTYTNSGSNHYFNLEYVDGKNTNKIEKSFCYGQITTRIFDYPKHELKSGCDSNYFAAFVDKDGTLMGKYDVTFKSGGNVGDCAYNFILCRPKAWSSNTAIIGKVW